MNIKRYIAPFVVVAILFAASPALHAQEAALRHSATFSWGVAIPAGDNSFANKATFVTPQLAYEYRCHALFSAGLSVGLSLNDEKGRTEDRFDGDLITGESHRKLTLLPIQVQLKYFPLGNKTAMLQPYLGIGAGVQYAEFYITGDAIVTTETGNWAEVITPQVGLRCQPQGKRFYADLSAHWQHGGNSWKIIESKSQQNFGVRLGVGYSF